MQAKIDKLNEEITKLDQTHEQFSILILRTAARLTKINRRRRTLRNRVLKLRRELRDQKKWQPLGPLNNHDEQVK